MASNDDDAINQSSLYVDDDVEESYVSSNVNTDEEEDDESRLLNMLDYDAGESSVFHQVSVPQDSAPPESTGAPPDSTAVPQVSTAVPQDISNVSQPAEEEQDVNVVPSLPNLPEDPPVSSPLSSEEGDNSIHSRKEGENLLTINSQDAADSSVDAPRAQALSDNVVVHTEEPDEEQAIFLPKGAMESPDSTKESKSLATGSIETSRGGGHSFRRFILLLGLILLVVVIIAAVIVPIVFLRDESSDSKATTGVEDPSAITPTVSPSTGMPTVTPTNLPTGTPSIAPTFMPTTFTMKPTRSAAPTPVPTGSPSSQPSSFPSTSPPTNSPTTNAPSWSPTASSAPTRDGLEAFLSTLRTISNNPDALMDRTTPEYAAMMYLFNSLNMTDQALWVEIAIEPDRMTQRYALLVLDFSTQGGSQLARNAVLPKFANALDECLSTGVTCYEGTNTVKEVVWAKRGLAGKLPADLGLLRNVTKLDLAENSLSGPLPDSLYNMKQLESLYLHQNRLTGTISNDISRLRALVHVYLGDNLLSGVFPAGLGSGQSGSNNVRPLRYLSLYNNNLEGTIPTGLNLRNLYYLDLGRNNMTGPLPTDWWQNRDNFRELRHLYLNHNSFNGTFPANFVAIGSGRLNTLVINDNKFRGIFPGRFDPTNFLQVLEIQNNDFSQIDKDLCFVSVFVGGEMTTFRSDCSTCNCGKPFCQPPYCTF